MNAISEGNITLHILGRDHSAQIAAGTPLLDLLESDSSFPQDTVAAKLDGEIIGLKDPVEKGGELQLLTLRDPEGMQVYYHSTAHLMAQAVTELFPGAKLAIGPAIDEGFYYDFEVEKPFTPDDLERIEKRMTERAKERLPIERFVMSREEALNDYKAKGETYKTELIEDFEDDEFSFFKQGDFTDMCRGPHLPHTGKLKNFKLLSIAGAYWRGDENQPMLQRIYGTAAASKKDLKAFLQKLEEAKERDHRKLGKELDLFSVHDLIGPGLILWHPNGARVRHVIETFWRDEHYRRGYELAYIPHIMREEVFHQSGHLDNYSENMYSPMQIDDNNYYVKPMNCPGHILIYKSHLRSYRDLPIRYAELGTVYRYERSGTLHGLLRVRGFTQDDAHIFCTLEQLEDEINSTIELVDFMMTAFGFEYQIELATRPEKSMGSGKLWEYATATLKTCIDKTGKPYKIDEGGGVFYGPKIDVKLLDALGRTWQGPTIQLDFNLPERFDVDYIDRNGDKNKVVMIHRTVLGSMERFMGNLIEHYKGAFPGWLAPVQVKILPITDDQIPYARELEARLRRESIRVDLDSRNEKINYKVREAESLKIPVMWVAGKREVENETVSIRERGRKDLGTKSFEEALDHIKTVTAVPRRPLE